MAAVAAAINARNGAVTASATNGLLRLQSATTGAASTISVTGPDDSGWPTWSTARTRPGTVDGNASPRPRTPSRRITGVSMTLVAPTLPTGVALTVDRSISTPTPSRRSSRRS